MRDASTPSSSGAPHASHAQGSAAPGTSVDDAARELYALGPAEFTAARNARADATPDRSSATAIRALRKPTVAAWAVNLLAQEQRLGDALLLAAELREAQDDLDAAELARLGRQRRALVAALAGDAVALARGRGVAVSASARDEIENTLNAAMTDAAAAAATASGRLVRTLRASGLDAVDIDGAVAGTAPAPAAPRRPGGAARAQRGRARAAQRRAYALGRRARAHPRGHPRDPGARARRPPAGAHRRPRGADGGTESRCRSRGIRSVRACGRTSGGRRESPRRAVGEGRRRGSDALVIHQSLL